MLIAATLTLLWVFNVLLWVALFVLLVLGLRRLFGLIGWTIPQPIWTVIGVICFLILAIMVVSGNVPMLYGGHR